MPHAVVRPDTLYAWSGPSLLVVSTRGERAEDQRPTGAGVPVKRATRKTRTASGLSRLARRDVTFRSVATLIGMHVVSGTTLDRWTALSDEDVVSRFSRGRRPCTKS